MSKKIVLGADGSGFKLKEVVKKHLEMRGYEVTDIGTHEISNPSHYYDVGFNVGKEVSEGNYERGIVFCGSGMGVGIAANKIPGVYAAVCDNIYETQQARIINNANVLALGGNFVTPEIGIIMVDTFLDTEFAQGLPTETKEYLTKCLEEINKKEEELYK